MAKQKSHHVDVPWRRVTTCGKSHTVWTGTSASDKWGEVTCKNCQRIARKIAAEIMGAEWWTDSPKA